MPQPFNRQASPAESKWSECSSDTALTASVESLAAKLQAMLQELGVKQDLLRRSQESQFLDLRRRIDDLAPQGCVYSSTPPATGECPEQPCTSPPVLVDVVEERPSAKERAREAPSAAELDARHEMLMAVLDVDDVADGVRSGQAKQLLRNRNRYSDEHGVGIDDLFRSLQRDSQLTRSFSFTTAVSGRLPSKERDDIVVPFNTFAKTVFLADEEASQQFDPHVVEAIKLLREFALSDDAREVVKAVLDIRDFEDPESAGCVERILEPIMSLLILANAYCIGFFAKRKSDGSFTAAEATDAFFATAFFLEMVFKIWRNGLRKHFMGLDKHWNRFDAIIVLLGILDLFMTSIISSSTGFNPSSFTALRLVRLARLTRLARIVRVPLFRELKLMLFGLLALLRTLLCAFVLLFMTVYLFGIIIVQYVPETSTIVESQEILFSSLSTSMFTVFRCLMLGDCNTISGSPVPLHMHVEFGWIFTIPYCLACVVMNYGIGSLITALVVDSTLNAAKLAEFKQSLNREEKMKTASRLHRLASMLEEKQQTGDISGAESFTESSTLLFMSRSSFETAMRDQQVKKLLDELDIDEVDQHDLFDALDSDGNDRLEIEELVQGILKMRGKARKVDVVASRLMLRTLNHRIVKLDGLVRGLYRAQQESIQALLGQSASELGCEPGRETS